MPNIQHERTHSHCISTSADILTTTIAKSGISKGHNGQDKSESTFGDLAQEVHTPCCITTRYPDVQRTFTSTETYTISLRTSPTATLTNSKRLTCVDTISLRQTMPSQSYISWRQRSCLVQLKTILVTQVSWLYQTFWPGERCPVWRCGSHRWSSRPEKTAHSSRVWWKPHSWAALIAIVMYKPLWKTLRCCIFSLSRLPQLYTKLRSPSSSGLYLISENEKGVDSSLVEISYIV